MSSNRKAAVTTGVLFITATAASLLGTALEPALNGANYLTRVSANANNVTGGVLLEFIAAVTSVGIAISLFPILQRWSAGLALGSVVFRAIEAVMYIAGAVSLLSLLSASQQFTGAGAPDRATFQAIGDSLVSVREHAILAGVFAFSLGALLYYYVFFQSRLIPRWLSGWGIAGIVLTLSACLSALFSHHSVTTYALLVLPIGVQEIVMAVWLIGKGFSSSVQQRIGSPSWQTKVGPPHPANGSELSRRPGVR